VEWSSGFRFNLEFNDLDRGQFLRIALMNSVTLLLSSDSLQTARAQLGEPLGLRSSTDAGRDGGRLWIGKSIPKIY
jgi:hypothetical protein